LVILLGLIFLLDRSTQDQTMKISFIFFRALFQLICIYKVQAIFWNYLNCLEKVLTSRDTCRTRRAPGRGSRCRLPGHVALPARHPEGCLGFGTRDTWHAPKGFRRGGSWFGLPGHVACSEGVLRCGLRDTWHAPKENLKGSFGVGRFIRLGTSGPLD